MDAALLGRALCNDAVIGFDGIGVPMASARAILDAHNDRLAGDGMRILAVAQGDIELDAGDEFSNSGFQLTH